MRRFLLLSSVLILVILGGVGCSPVEQPTLVLPTATPWPVPRTFEGPEYGVNLHVWWDAWASQRDWRLAWEAGFAWAKQGLPWRDVRPFPDQPYDWTHADRIVEEAEAWGLHLVFRLDHPPAWAMTDEHLPVPAETFGAFCTDVAGRYRGRVAGYQIWNEPNLAREWAERVPDPAGYTELLRACYVAIKEADPEALVISAGLAPTGSGPPLALPDPEFLVGMYAAGAAPYFDLLGLHAPGYAAPPEISPAEAAATPEYGGQPFFCFRHAEELRAVMIAQGDAAKRVALLEFGWTTDPIHPAYSWFAVTPEQQADYLVRALTYAEAHWADWMGPMFVWNIPDAFWTPETEEFWWGIVDPFYWQEGTPRPAYETLAGWLTKRP